MNKKIISMYIILLGVVFIGIYLFILPYLPDKKVIDPVSSKSGNEECVMLFDERLNEMYIENNDVKFELPSEYQAPDNCSSDVVMVNIADGKYANIQLDTDSDAYIVPSASVSTIIINGERFESNEVDNVPIVIKKGDNVEVMSKDGLGIMINDNFDVDMFEVDGGTLSVTTADDVDAEIVVSP